MRDKILKIVLRNESKFVPLVFTKKQFNVMFKLDNGDKLSNAEKKAIYTSINKKLDALDSLIIKRDNEYYLNGSGEIIESRIEEAKKLIDRYAEDLNKVFIGGSFLFEKDYNDVDIFIIRKKGYKETWDGKYHIIFLPENRLSEPIFQSASLISISNFLIPKILIKNRPSLSELMSIYHEAIIERLNKEKKSEMIRRLVFDYYLFCKNEIINGKALKEHSSKASLEELDNFIKELLVSLFSESYLYIELHEYIKTLVESIRNINPKEHLERYTKTYEDLIYERPKNKGKNNWDFWNTD